MGGTERERELAALSEPFSKVSSLAPLQNIPVRDRGESTLYLMMLRQELLSGGHREREQGGDIWPGPRR